MKTNMPTNAIQINPWKKPAIATPTSLCATSQQYARTR